jgi:hypothetical protein
MLITLQRPVKFSGDGDFVPAGSRVEVDGEEGRRLCLKGAAVIFTPSPAPQTEQVNVPQPSVKAEVVEAPKPVEKKPQPGKKIAGKR